MPASPPPCNSEARRRLGSDASGVSEVIGYILSFAILSTVLLVALLTFNSARAQAEERVTEVEVASIAHRVAEAVIQVGVYAEAHAGSSPEVTLRLELPAGIGSRGYSVDLCTMSGTSCSKVPCDPSGAGTAANAVRVTSGSTKAYESLLGISAKVSCASAGRIAIVYSTTGSSLSLVNA